MHYLIICNQQYTPWKTVLINRCSLYSQPQKIYRGRMLWVVRVRIWRKYRQLGLRLFPSRPVKTCHQHRVNAPGGIFGASSTLPVPPLLPPAPFISPAPRTSTSSSSTSSPPSSSSSSSVPLHSCISSVLGCSWWWWPLRSFSSSAIPVPIHAFPGGICLPHEKGRCSNAKEPIFHHLTWYLKPMLLPPVKIPLVLKPTISTMPRMLMLALQISISPAPPP